jgi:hypothetical protein
MRRAGREDKLPEAEEVKITNNILIPNVSRPILDLTEFRDGPIHHLTFQSFQKFETLIRG